MATLDIRDTNEEITEIKFSDEDYTFSIYKKDIPNLIKALNKAKELGWY